MIEQIVILAMAAAGWGGEALRAGPHVLFKHVRRTLGFEFAE